MRLSCEEPECVRARASDKQSTFVDISQQHAERRQIQILLFVSVMILNRRKIVIELREENTPNRIYINWDGIKCTMSIDCL